MANSDKFTCVLILSFNTVLSSLNTKIEDKQEASLAREISMDATAVAALVSINVLFYLTVVVVQLLSVLLCGFNASLSSTCVASTTF